MWDSNTAAAPGKHASQTRLSSVLLLLVLMCLGGRTLAATPPTGFFPIGVYRQPTSTYGEWKSRGINTVVDFFAAGNTLGMNQFNSAAVANNLWVIRNPYGKLKVDARQTNLLAYSHGDEPDINGISPRTLVKEFSTWKKAAQAIPVITNFSGVNAIYQSDSLTDALYKNYIRSTDWVSNDIYPITAWNHPQWIDLAVKPNLSDPYNLTGVRWNPGTSVDKLRELSKGKKQIAYIETSFQNLSQANSVGARGATAAEVRGETWDAIVHGATGIVYFPFSFPNNPDGTPPDVVTEMTKTDRMIAALGAVLNRPTDSTANALKLTSSQLEGTWRSYKGKLYFFVLNFSHTAIDNVSIELKGLMPSTTQIGEYDTGKLLSLSGGAVTDSFGPYEMHIYTQDTLPVAVGSGAPVPEPGTGGLFLLLTGASLLKRRRR